MVKHTSKMKKKTLTKRKPYKKPATKKRAAPKRSSSRSVHRKQSDGFYHIGGKKYKELIGRKPDGSSSKLKVWHGTAYRTPGGLTRRDLKYNPKTHRVVSARKSAQAKKDNRLYKMGFRPEKGKPFKKFKKSDRK